jgi:hypothetical protein
MGEYIAAQGPIPRVIGDETTKRNAKFINELRSFEISGLDLPQVIAILLLSTEARRFTS